MSGSRSLIDHILVSSNVKDCVNSCTYVDNVDNSSDHIAIKVKLKLNCDYFASKDRIHTPKTALY